MANYVLVHGGNVSTDKWNELTQRNDYPSGGYLGGRIWDNIKFVLREKGHCVFAPTLKNENINNLSDHIEQICELIIEHDLRDVILVGHSYGGMVITGVADKMADRIGLLVYLDAALPEPGQSLFDILTISGFDPVDVVSGSPKAYTEKLQFDPEKIKLLLKTYILCTKSEFISVTNLVKQKITTEKEEWKYFELPTSHIPQCTMPDELAQLLLEFGESY